MSFSIRLTGEEKALAESYAKLHSVSLGEAFKRALFERMILQLQVKHIRNMWIVVINQDRLKNYGKN